MSRNFRPLTSSATQKAVPIAQAIENSSALGLISSQIHESSRRLKVVESLIPDALRPVVQAGPIEGQSWCLLVTTNSAAAKLRQLSPLLLARLRNDGIEVNSIRLKILISRRQ